jgi:hypothetical protein
MPALLPSGSLLFEESSHFINGEHKSKLLEVSPDGYIKVPSDLSSLGGNRNIALEIKCPFPNTNNLPNHYSIPVYYTIQLLCEMKSRGVDKCWYVSYNESSVVLISVTFDSRVWDEIWCYICAQYDKEKEEIVRPTKKVEYKESVINMLKDYLQENATLVAEVPSLQAQEGSMVDVAASGPFRMPRNTSPTCSITSRTLSTRLKLLCITCKELLKVNYQLKRRKAHEILTFVLADTDRIHSERRPDQVPIAYALKGYSLHCDVMRKMINKVKDACHIRGIKVLATCFDGQWAQLTKKSDEGKPLNRAQFQTDCHQKFANKRKDVLLSNLLTHSEVRHDDVDVFSQLEVCHWPTFSGNIAVTCTQTDDDGTNINQIYLETVGKNGNIPLMKHITSTRVKKAWIPKCKKGTQQSLPENQCATTCAASASSIRNDVISTSQGTQSTDAVGHVASEESVEKNPVQGEGLGEEIALTDGQQDEPIIPIDFPSDYDDEDMDFSENHVEDYISASQMGVVTPENDPADIISASEMSHVPSTPSVTPVMSGMEIRSTEPFTERVLELIVEELKKGHRQKLWLKRNLSVDLLQTDILPSATAINSLFTKAEMEMCSSVVESVTGITILQKEDKKLKYLEVNKICEMFGNKTYIDAPKRNPLTLFTRTKRYILDKNYPKAVLAAANSKIEYICNIDAWESSSTINLQQRLPESCEVHNMFSFPQYSVTRQQIEPCTLDPTHMLTNLRVQCSTRNLFRGKHCYCRGSDFLDVSKADNTILHRPFVSEMIDKQSQSIAMQVFSESVQKKMEDQGHETTALTVERIRNWYAACDERGLAPATRIKYLHAMHSFLLKNVDFAEFPPFTTHVHGLPTTTWQGLLQCCDLRIYLYNLASSGTYNQRSVSTLFVEGFFSRLTDIDRSGTGCPKASQIPWLISRMLRLDWHKNDPDRSYFMQLSRNNVYPFYAPDIDVGNYEMQTYDTFEDKESEHHVKPHHFDHPRQETRRKSRHIYKENYSRVKPFHMSARGEQTIRQDHYKRNDSKVLPLHRHGIYEEDKE